MGYLRRLTVSFPPGHGKSETTNVWFPTWDLEHRKDDRLILATYEGTFAEEWGKKVRSVIEENTELLTVRFKGDSQAANRWRTRDGGGMWTVGAGGAITGRRARLFLIDDAIKGWAEANSPLDRGRNVLVVVPLGRTNTSAARRRHRDHGHEVASRGPDRHGARIDALAVGLAGAARPRRAGRDARGGGRCTPAFVRR